MPCTGRLRSLCTTLALTAVSVTAMGGTKLRLDIPAQDLGAALKEFSADADEQLLFSPALVAGLQSTKLRGDFTREEALAILLQGTTLQVNKTASGVLLIVPANSSSARPTITQAEQESPYTFVRLAQTSNAPVTDTTSQPEESVPTLGNDSALEEVTVTARYKSESLQRAPLSVTALSGGDIENRGYTNVSQVAASAPNVNLEPAPGGFGKSVFASIRGVGQSDFKFTLEPGVGFYVDDVYFATVFGSIFTLGDINRVEILRGPQGTLFGKNSEGGAVRIFNERPNGDESGFAEVGYGSYNRESVRAAMNFTLIPDQLFARLSGGALRSDGYQNVVDFACAHPGQSGKIKPTAFGDCNVGKLGGDNVYDFRAALRWMPTDKLEINISGDLTDDKGPGPADTIVNINPTASFLGTPQKAGYNANVLIPAFGIPYDTRFLPPNPYTTYATFKDPIDGYNIPSDNTLYSWGFTGIVDWDNPWGFHVKSITGLRGEHGEFSQSYGGAPIPLVDLYTTLAHHQFSEELQFSGVSFNNALEWTVGAYYFNGTNHQGGLGDLIEISLVQVPDDPSTDKNKSAFAHLEWHITDKLSSEIGLRYSNEDKSYQYYRLLLYPYQGHAPGDFLFPITSKSLSYNRVDPKVGFQYQWTPELMTYVQWSTGFKAGGFNTRPVTAAQVTTFKPETLTAYEVGLKSEWFEHRLRANAAVFYSLYKDLQLQANGVDNDGNLAVLTKNVGHADIKGAELEVQAEPIRGLTADMSLGYLDYKNKDLGSAANVSGGPTLYSVPPLTPKWKGSLGVQYRVNLPGTYGTLMPRIDYTYQSLVYNDAPNTLLASQAGYGVMNSRLIYTSAKGAWTATFAVNNTTNKFYYIDKYANYGTYGTIEGQPVEPRNYNFTLKRSF
jgi:iron complex outermembrane recepter protein